MGVSETESEGVSGLAMARSEAAPGPSFDEARSFAGFGETRTVDRGLAECGTPRVERDQIPHAATSAAAAADVSLLSLLFCRCRDALAAQSISTSFSTKHQIHLASVSKTTPVAPRRCPSTAGSPNHNSTSPSSPTPSPRSDLSPSVAPRTGSPYHAVESPERPAQCRVQLVSRFTGHQAR